MPVVAERKRLAMIKDEVDFYQHQADGVRDLYRRGSFVLGDDMGLGKTLQAMTVAACDFERGKATRVIVVCPVSLKGNWADELDKFTHFTHVVLEGDKAKRQRQLDAFDADYLIVNYEQVVAHIEQLIAMRFDIAIFDEAHMIKGWQSKRSRACKTLSYSVQRRNMVMTGSPILNHVDDLWMLLHVVRPDEYPNYYTFTNRYAVFGGWKGKSVVGTKNVDELNARLAQVMLRRKKSDVLDLPEKHRTSIMVDLSPLQAKLYDQANDDLMLELPDNPDPMELENALTKMLRLKQICGTAATIEGYDDSSTKLDVAVERIAELIEAGERVVVFTQFRKVLECLVARLERTKVQIRHGDKQRQEKIKTFQLHGDVKAHLRQGVVKQWAAAEPGVLCCMLQVASVGLNMTAARHAVFLDKLWSPKMNEQAEDRLHRIGAHATQPVEIISIACRGTVEGRIETILRTKRKTFDTIVEEDDWKRRLIESLKEEGMAA